MPITVSLTPGVEPQWHFCHAQNHEMKILSQGRRLFPTLNYTVAGLEPKAEYSMWIHMERVDDKKLRHNRVRYDENLSKELEYPSRQVCHLLGEMPGEYWTERNVNFEGIKITYTKSVEGNGPLNIHLHTYHRYLPVLTIISGGNKIHEAKFENTMFFPVTCIHNEVLRNFKVNNDPYCFDRVRRRQETDPPQPLKRIQMEDASETNEQESNSISITIPEVPDSAHSVDFSSLLSNPFYQIYMLNDLISQKNQQPNVSTVYRSPSPSFSTASTSSLSDNVLAETESEDEIEID